MQLKKIKLAGFKSFVDPTTILVPSNLVAIVGPNGCGKSNVMDAVLWVMGESSAKRLRGISSDDVIFNGSTARKPVGQASVELVFDNQHGALGGEYASYGEISIRRQISRDSESAYFLNGVRCRRRDIIDIFLGTGLGPRSYSIIGQNMISGVVMAKPEEMRIYLEEAAGISRYKERRRETENRIQHTKDNLARLNDVRAELEKQLSTLQRQANAAEKFKLLKQEERLVRGQWYAIQWRHLDSCLVKESLQIQQQSTGLEACQAQVSETNLQIEYQREVAHQANEAFQEVQRRHYTVSNDIGRLEQEIQHQEERLRQWQADIQQIDSDYSLVNHERERAQEEERYLEEELFCLEPTAPQAVTALNTEVRALEAAEEAMQDWQKQWDEFNEFNSKVAQAAQVEQTRIQHLEQKISTLTQQQAKFDQDKPGFDFIKLENEMVMFAEQISEIEAKAEDYIQQMMETRNQLSALQMTQQQGTQKLNQIRNELQKARGQQASLEALQQTALGQRHHSLTQWLAQNQLDQRPRLAQGIEVEAGWEQAVEKVLGAYLQAVCVDDLSEVVPFVEQFSEGSLCLFAQKQVPTPSQYRQDKLLSKVKSSWDLDSLLSNIYIAESQHAAFDICKSLAAHESVITREGVWLSPSWLRILRDKNPESGIFQREQDLKQLAQHIAGLSATHDEVEENLKHYEEQLKVLENQRDSLQKVINQIDVQSAEIRARQKMRKTQLSELQTRAERFSDELKENKIQLEKAYKELTHTRSTWQQAMSDLENQVEQRDVLNQKRENLREQLYTLRGNVDRLRDEAHQVEIRLKTTQAKQTSVKQNIMRLDAQLTTLTARKTALQGELDAAQSLESRREHLATLLSSRLLTEEEMNKARYSLESVHYDLNHLESRKQALERDVAHFRDCLEDLRVQRQGVKVKSETLMEQLNETGLQLEAILQDLPIEVNLQEWEERLENITQRIVRLGAINLVAIEEYATCSERKQYLDKQYEDLQEGLNTLENAIAKIDKETRTKFKETFEKVNTRFQELFPIVFGGGKAYLELTDENLLDAGITVMACPPGKRNSTIHLLSGGEKAMTAIALVFSIFHLNPAPFCMLDEVDAPLDDANIGRFCQLVKTMADKTQFIFISHNKLAIEMGENLIGVTMHEPGVSRLVSVDMHEALSLAGVPHS
ncbi:MAG: smc 1 [Gammaproteobacteria bacterium]|jgi:chromosome segregation protein|nr:smc 1 [Gammaproteobacteria bacterium]